MATIGAIATMSDLAFKKLFQAMTDINTAFPDVEPAILPAYRDVRYQEASRYQAMADWAARLAVAMGVSSIPDVVAQAVESPADDIPFTDAASEYVPQEVKGDVFPLEAKSEASEESAETDDPYEGMTNKELRAVADERGIATKSLHSQAELINALLAADVRKAQTENEQADADKD
jgi:hypothetical protein